MAKFIFGTVAVTPGIDDLMEQGLVVNDYLFRHLKGDWGDMDAHDRRANDRALKDGTRLFSAYNTPFGKIWVITESDRSYTTILLPSEY